MLSVYFLPTAHGLQAVGVLHGLLPFSAQECIGADVIIYIYIYFLSAASEQTLLLPSPVVRLYHQRALAATLLYIKQGSDGVRNEGFGIILRTNSFQIYRDASTLLIHTQLCRYRHVFMSQRRICIS